MKKKHIYGVDIIKVLGTLLVIGVHQFARIGYYTIPQGKGTIIFGLTGLFSVFLSCVPLFLMATGYLLSSRKIDKVHYKKLIFFFIEVFVIMVITTTVLAYYQNDWNLITNIKAVIKRIIQPLYYIGLYFNLYLLAPFLNKLYFSLTKSQKKVLVIVLLLTISLPKALNQIPYISFFETRLTSAWMILYYVLGLVIYDMKPRISLLNATIVLALSSLLFASLNVALSYGEVYQAPFGYYENIFTVINTVVIFTFFVNVNISNEVIQRVLVSLSSSTLAFYVYASYFTDDRLRNYIKVSGDLLVDLSTIPLMMIFSFLFAVPFGLLSTYISKKINKNISKRIGI